MVRRQVELDEESDRILAALAEEYQGDVNKALAELLRTSKGLDTFAEQCEEAHHDALAAQKERSEREFREGRVTTWDEMKRRLDL